MMHHHTGHTGVTDSLANRIKWHSHYLQSANFDRHRLGDIGESTPGTVHGESLAVALEGTGGELYSVLVECVAIVDAQHNQTEDGQGEEMHGGDR